ncbi:hypothetical protein EOD39_9544 [Acipenser ruthenus]|uniref:Integrase core domain-containing protein n=1 Tax=Acipenser ruthenus TaxID=7906 RepID=A0A444U0B7_ACIRT|nr:hypothetical protein EOD39_9544 [Acipenser ruthenus]
MVVYLKAAANNHAATVFQSFFNAVQEYGQPSRVRSDKGRENNDVARFMVSVMGTDRNIAGKSVHNQRIECLWRDVFICVLETFYHMFYEMDARACNKTPTLKQFMDFRTAKTVKENLKQCIKNSTAQNAGSDSEIVVTIKSGGDKLSMADTLHVLLATGSIRQEIGP